MTKELKIGNWYVGWHTWKTEITYSECGYNDGRANLTISLFGWLSRFYFPWKSKRFPYGDCDAPQLGIAIHSKTLWIYKGGRGNLGGGTRYWTWDLPFVNYGTTVRWDMLDGISYEEMLFSFKPLKMEYWFTKEELKLLGYESKKLD